VLDDGARTYAWDAENRLIGIADKASGATSQLSYDGLSRRVGVIDRSGPGATPVETRYLWCGQVLCQARDGQDRIIRRYYPQGELQGNTKLYYARDQLWARSPTRSTAPASRWAPATTAPTARP